MIDKELDDKALEQYFELCVTYCKHICHKMIRKFD